MCVERVNKYCVLPINHIRINRRRSRARPLTKVGVAPVAVTREKNTLRGPWVKVESSALTRRG